MVAAVYAVWGCFAQNLLKSISKSLTSVVTVVLCCLLLSFNLQQQGQRQRQTTMTTLVGRFWKILFSVAMSSSLSSIASLKISWKSISKHHNSQNTTLSPAEKKSRNKTKESNPYSRFRSHLYHVSWVYLVSALKISHLCNKSSPQILPSLKGILPPLYEG